MPTTLTVYGFKGQGVSNDTLDHNLGASGGNRYYRAYSAAPTAAGGGTEAGWSGYASQLVVDNSTNFPAASSQQKTNGVDIVFPALGGGSSPVTIIGIALCKTPSGALGANDIVYYCELLTARSLIVGDVLTVPAGQLTFTEA